MGTESLTAESQGPIGLTTWREHAQPMALFVGLRERQDRAREAETALRLAQTADQRARASDRFDRALRELDEHLSYMAGAGLQGPEMPWAERMAELRRRRPR